MACKKGGSKKCGSKKGGKKCKQGGMNKWQ